MQAGPPPPPPPQQQQYQWVYDASQKMGNWVLAPIGASEVRSRGNSAGGARPTSKEEATRKQAEEERKVQKLRKETKLRLQKRADSDVVKQREEHERIQAELERRREKRRVHQKYISEGPRVRPVEVFFQGPEVDQLLGLGSPSQHRTTSHHSGSSTVKKFVTKREEEEARLQQEIDAALSRANKVVRGGIGGGAAAADDGRLVPTEKIRYQRQVAGVKDQVSALQSQLQQPYSQQQPAHVVMRMYNNNNNNNNNHVNVNSNNNKNNNGIMMQPAQPIGIAHALQQQYLLQKQQQQQVLAGSPRQQQQQQSFAPPRSLIPPPSSRIPPPAQRQNPPPVMKQQEQVAKDAAAAPPLWARRGGAMAEKDQGLGGGGGGGVKFPAILGAIERSVVDSLDLETNNVAAASPMRGGVRGARQLRQQQIQQQIVQQQQDPASKNSPLLDSLNLEGENRYFVEEESRNCDGRASDVHQWFPKPPPSKPIVRAGAAGGAASTKINMLPVLPPSSQNGQQNGSVFQVQSKKGSAVAVRPIPEKRERDLNITEDEKALLEELANLDMKLMEKRKPAPPPRRYAGVAAQRDNSNNDAYSIASAPPAVFSSRRVTQKNENHIMGGGRLVAAAADYVEEEEDDDMDYDDDPRSVISEMPQARRPTLHPVVKGPAIALRDRRLHGVGRGAR